MESTMIKVVWTNDGKVVLEGVENFLRMCLQPTGEGTSTVLQSAGNEQAAKRVSPAEPRSERELIAEKRPRNQTETVAVLAFCMAENGQAEFTEADIRRAYVRAGVRPPKVIAQAVRDAKNNFDLIESGLKRGTYRLSPHGDRTVRFDLPRSEP